MGDERMRAFRAVLAIAALAVVFSVGMAAAEEGNPTSCCGTLFTSQAEATEHMIEHHGKEGCAACGTLFETQQQKVEHAVEHHGKKGCVHCSVMFESDEEAEAHVCGHGHTS
jgi:hypothetical protein